MVARDAAHAARGGAARHPGAGRLQPRALHPQSQERRDRAADPGERPRRRARAGDARLRRHLDRAWQRLGRPRDGRCQRSHPRSARRSRLYAAARLAQRGGAGGLLLRLRQRRAVAAMPYRLRAPDLSRAATGSSIVAVNERFADAVVQEATPRRSDRARAGLPLRASAPHGRDSGCPRRPSSPSGTSPGRTPRPSASAPGARRSSTGLLGSTILGFHTQFHCNNFLEAADRFMESRIDREHASVTLGGHGDHDPRLSDLDRMAACGARRRRLRCEQCRDGRARAVLAAR